MKHAEAFEVCEYGKQPNEAGNPRAVPDAGQIALIPRMSDLAGQLRALPSVDEVVSRLEGRYPRRLLVDETRRVIAALRDEIRGGRESDAGTVEARVDRGAGRARPSDAAAGDQRYRGGTAHEPGPRAASRRSSSSAATRISSTIWPQAGAASGTFTRRC